MPTMIQLKKSMNGCMEWKTPTNLVIILYLYWREINGIRPIRTTIAIEHIINSSSHFRRIVRGGQNTS